MNVLITGGAGYIGFALVDALLRIAPKDTKITLYDNLSRGNRNIFFSRLRSNRVRFVNGELLDSRLLQKEVEKADVVYHLAAKVTTPFADSDSHIFEQVNHWGTAELVNAIVQHPVQHFIHVSSLSVYGRAEGPLGEDNEIRPESFYGFSKARAETHVKRLQDNGIPTHIIRSGNVYGYNPCVRFDAVINRFMFLAHTEGRIMINGSGQQRRAFVHVDKLGHTLAALLHHKVPTGIYNLAEHNLTVNEIADIIKDLYPKVERLYINQHLQLRELFVHTPVAITQYLPLPERTILSELETFRAAFGLS